MMPEKWVQKFDTDDVSLPRSGKCFCCFWFNGWSKFSANQKHHSDLGGDDSSVWNFCTCAQNVGCNLRLTTTGSTTKTASEKWESRNVDCNIRLTIGVEKYEMGDSRKYPYPTTGGMSILTPPCPWKFQNAYPPLALRIPKSLTPPLLRNFPLLFQTLWNSCSSA